MTRKAALAAIKACGSEGNRAGMLRLYTENRVSIAAAQAAYAEGAQFARFIAARDATKSTEI